MASLTCCLFCRGSEAEPLVGKAPSNDGRKGWSTACVESLSNLFHLPRDNPLQLVLANANSCADCRLLIQDVDFTLRQLNALVKRIEARRRQLYEKMFKNYELIPDRETYTVKYQDVEQRVEENESYSYNDIVKMIFEKFRDESKQVSLALEEFKKICKFDVRNHNSSSDGILVEADAIKKLKRRKFRNDESSYSDLGQVRSTENCNIKAKTRIDENNLNISSTQSEADLECDSVKIDLESNHSCDFSDSNVPLQTEDNEIEKKDENNLVKRKTKKKPKIKKEFKCDLCKLQFHREDRLIGHKRKMHEKDPTPFHCTLCPKRFKYSKSLAQHIERHGIKERLFFCIPCNKSYITQDSLNHHNKSFHHEAEYICSFCSMDFKSQEELLLHEDTHKNREQPFTCTVCNTIYTNTLKLKQHVKTAHTSKMKYCEICGDSFESHARLQKHILKHDASYVGFKCDKCTVVCSTQSSLNYHMFKHAETKSFICDVCGKSYTFPYALKRHKANHENDKKFECRICQKRFSCSAFLSNHEEIHSGAKMYHCSFCVKIFKTLTSLKQHEKTHQPNDNVTITRKRSRHKQKKNVTQEESDDGEESNSGNSNDDSDNTEGPTYHLRIINHEYLNSI